jgi:hypothetical protein
VIYSCPKCGKVLANESRARTPGQQLTPLAGVKVKVRPGLPPLLRCPCGRYVAVEEDK